MTKKHTPGPWRVVVFQRPGYVLWDVDASEVQHGEVERYFGAAKPGHPEPQHFSVLGDLRQADANLIAAAPEMLAILKVIAISNTGIKWHQWDCASHRRLNESVADAVQRPCNCPFGAARDIIKKVET